MPRKGAWGTVHHRRLTAAVLARDYDPALGFTPCHWCAQRATEADHWPLGRDEGGADALDNLVPACRSCNAVRGGTYRQGKGKAAAPSREW